jgi:hypothetical protein
VAHLYRHPYHIAIELSWKEFALAFVGLEIGINIAFALLYLASLASGRAASSIGAYRHRRTPGSERTCEAPPTPDYGLE